MRKQIRARLLLGIILATLSTGLSSPPRGLIAPVSMSLLDDRMFVSDLVSGLHVYDVTDLTSPQVKYTIPLHSNTGSAASGDVVFTNDNRNLYAIVLADEDYEIVATIELSPQYNDVWFEGGGQPRDTGFGCAPSCAREDASVAAASAPTSTGSSFTTFALAGDFLYYVDDVELVTLDVSAPEQPQLINKNYIGWTIETIYPTDGYLFVGGTRGMYIFDRSDPADPRQIGKVEHVRACDPVVVSDKTAYVTLRSGTRCGQSNDMLLAVDIADPTQPLVVHEKQMTPPFGLATQGSWLYVSTGRKGFELFNIAKPQMPMRVAEWSQWPTRDFIWVDDVLYVLSDDRLLIFDVTLPHAPVLLTEMLAQLNG